MKRTFLAISSTLGLLVGPCVLIANAKPEFAQKEDKTCDYCHLATTGGKDLGFRGLYYKSHELSFKDLKEAEEAKAAGVKKGAMGKKSKPTKPYPKKTD